MKTEIISRIDLARMTGLNKATITSIINDFIEMEIVTEAGPTKSSSGRKTAGISHNMHDTVVITARINRYEMDYAICDMNNKLINKYSVPYNDEGNIFEILHQLYENINMLIQAAGGKKILGISLAILGWVIQREGRFIARPHLFQVLGMVDIKKELEKLFPAYKVLIDHDANLSALAEWEVYTQAAGTSEGCMLSIVGGIGFGGGIIINGQLFRGKNGIAGEVGHMGINCNAYKYSSANTASAYQGYWEDYASPRALQRCVMESLVDNPETKLTGDSTISDIYRAYRERDPLAVRVLNRTARQFAYGLTGLVYVLDPDVIVLGDAIMREESYLDEIKKYLRYNLPNEIYDELDIRFSGITDDAILIGAKIAMIKEYLNTFEMIDFVKKHYTKAL